MGNSRGFRIVPKFNNNLCAIYIVYPNGDYRLICQVLMPHDNQMVDNMECAQLIADALKKRIRKSV
jgi:hypothetical protein